MTTLLPEPHSQRVVWMHRPFLTTGTVEAAEERSSSTLQDGVGTNVASYNSVIIAVARRGNETAAGRWLAKRQRPDQRDQGNRWSQA